MNECLAHNTNNCLNIWRPILNGVIFELLKKLDMKKRSNIENINTYFLKECMLVTLDEVAHLYNTILTTGIFRDDWKKLLLFHCSREVVIKRFRIIVQPNFCPVLVKLWRY